MADLIQEASDHAHDRHVIEAALYHNLKGLDAITAQLLAFIFALCSGDDEPQEPDDALDSTNSKPVPLAEFFTRLYRIGTGWLGWTPADTWSATPGEILEAYQGRTELLQAIFGSGDTEQASNSKPDLDASLDRQGLEDLRSLGSL